MSSDPRKGVSSDPGRARFSEVALAHNALKRKRNVPNMFAYHMGNHLPESAFYTQLSQFERRVDGILDAKLERVRTVVNKGDRSHLCECKYNVQLYVTLETTATTSGKAEKETEEGKPGEDGVAEEAQQKGGCDLYVYGSAELCEPPKTGSVDGAKGEKAKLDLTDVLKSVTVTGFKPANPGATGDEAAKSLEDVSFGWKAEDYTGEPSSCLKLDCSGLVPGSKVRVTWEVKHQMEKYVIPPQLVTILGSEPDTKTNIVAKLWNFMKLKGASTSDDAASVEFTNSTLKAFFTEGEKSTDIKLPVVGQKIRSMLTPSKRPTVEYTIPRDGDTEGTEEVKSLSFTVNLPSQSFASAVTEADKLLKKMKSTSKFDLMDKEIKRLVDEINERKNRRNFFLAFSESPVEFVTSLIESQQRDLTQLKESTDMELRSSRFKDAWVHDASIRYLHNQLASNKF